MNENEFRKQLNDALGQPPHMSAPLMSAGPAQRTRPQPRFMAVLAFALAVSIVLAFVATRLALHPAGNLSPSGRPIGRQVATPAALDSFPCALPVTADVEAGNPGQQPGVNTSIAGFINIPGGAFQVDTSAGVSDLPGAGRPIYYSAELKRWLNTGGRTVSPDGDSFAYATLLPAGATYSTFSSAELRVYTVMSKSDRKVWSFGGSIDVLAWTSSGILVDTVPPQGGIRLLWLIDPTTGSAAQEPATADPTRLPSGALPSGYHNWSYSGGDNGGRGLVRFGSRDPGTKYIVALDDNGTLTTIYTGVAGDAKDFDPGSMSFDAHGLWMGNYDGKYIWLWSQTTGLRNFTITGGVPAPTGYQFASVMYNPAGPCIPGTFIGADASALPAASSPTPSPSPPFVDWSSLESKPLHLQTLASGAACPISSSVNIAVKAQSGKWPNYGFGSGPAYISGQFAWYSAGSQAILVLVDPKYKGPVLIRIARIDGSGSTQLTGDGLQALGSETFGLPQTSSPPYWGTWIGSLGPSTPGCYGIQLDGTSFSDVVVIQVQNGAPPPG